MASIIFLVAAVAWVVALVQVLALVRLIPSASFFTVFQRIGRWDFAWVRQQAGPAAEPHIKRYKQAFVAFFIAILVFMAVTAFVLSMASPAPVTPAS